MNSTSNNEEIKISASSIWKVIATGATAFGAITSTAFVLGQKYQENLSNLSIAEVRERAVKSEAKLESLQGILEQTKQINKQVLANRESMKDSISKKNSQIEELSSRVGAANNCSFIHQQIESLQRELRLVGTGGIFTQPTPETETKDQARRESLEKMIARYQSQLGPGSCK
jgi:chromosome segregation ATPase